MLTYLAITNIQPLLRILIFHSVRFVGAIVSSLRHPLRGGKKRTCHEHPIQSVRSDAIGESAEHLLYLAAVRVNTWHWGRFLQGRYWRWSW